MVEITVVATDILTSVGSAIRQVREDRQISQEELGVRAELDRSYISSVENGRRNVSLLNLQKISEALGVSLTEIIQLAEDRILK